MAAVGSRFDPLQIQPNSPVCPLIRPRLQVADSDSLPRLVTTAARQALPNCAVNAMRCAAMRCDAMQRPNCRGDSQSVPANRARPPMALPLTRKPGLDAMEQSGSTKGRYCLVQPACLVPSICSVSIWFVGWLDVGRIDVAGSKRAAPLIANLSNHQCERPSIVAMKKGSASRPQQMAAVPNWASFSLPCSADPRSDTVGGGPCSCQTPGRGTNSNTKTQRYYKYTVLL